MTTTTIQTPDWVKNAVFYQIFPDRFAKSERTVHPLGLEFKPWGSPAAEQGYQGGDLRGIVDQLDYLKALGINAIYLNPIFSSASNHRYHTFDYMQVDPLLGGNEALRELLDEAHGRDIRIVLDGVFNHASRGFWPFHHILENGGNSPYIDWFFVHDWPLRPYEHGPDRPHNYAAWWNLPALPKFNTNNPGVRQYIYEVARFWIEFGMDGWRLDVPAEIDDDEFWRGFREVVKTANPEAYIVGEIWHEAQRWLSGDQFDAVMNYIFADKVMSFCGRDTLRPDYTRDHFTLAPLTGAEFREAIDEMHALYDWEVTQVQLNLLDSHDTARALWIMGDDKSALRLAAFLQMTFPGAPCIYYGTEIGMTGGDDPDCREAFLWHDEEAWDNELLATFQALTALRHAHPVLRTGSFEAVHGDETTYVFVRKLGEETAVVAINTGSEPATLTLDLPPADYTQVWPPHTAAGPTLTIPARDGIVWVSGTH